MTIHVNMHIYTHKSHKYNCYKMSHVGYSYIQPLYRLRKFNSARQPLGFVQYQLHCILLSLQFIAENLETVLEVADTPLLLEVVVQNLLYIAKVTPQNLSPHFKVCNVSLGTKFNY